MRRAIAGALVVAAVGVAVALGVTRARESEGARCAAGFVAVGPRCTVPVGTCPPPLRPTVLGCDAPDVRVSIPASTFAVGPSDWEAQGRVVPRSITVQPFRIDAFEVTRGRMVAKLGDNGTTDDPARAASGIPREQAAAFCAFEGGRLPTEDEWIAAAASASNPPHRYPWGDTGAVCRRAAWGLTTGPCDNGPAGPDTVGAHSDGDTPFGLHDMAGNVAEWVSGEPPAAKGGSYADSLASELRIWARLEAPAASNDPRIGFRCVYPP